MSYFVQDIAVIGQQALKAVGYLQPINYSQNAIVIRGVGGGIPFFLRLYIWPKFQSSESPILTILEAL